MIDYEARTEARVKEAMEEAEVKTKEGMRKEAKNLKEKGYSNEQILEQLGLI